MTHRDSRPVGNPTRGTTHPNRLRRMDRWIAATHGPALRRATSPPLVVDLGYGAAPWTAVELLTRLRAVRGDLRVTGLEINPDRVADAQPYARPGLEFALGGFEVPLAPPLVIRAANVLRQYEEGEVWPVWERLRSRLAPGGLLVDGTCDEIGRRHVWVALTPEGPRSVTFATRLADLRTPSDLAERLPKALIHRNVPGEQVHAFLRDFDHVWTLARRYAPLSARQRWLYSVNQLAARWPLLGSPARWRQGEVTVRWAALRPRGAPTD